MQNQLNGVFENEALSVLSLTSELTSCKREQLDRFHMTIYLEFRINKN